MHAFAQSQMRRNKTRWRMKELHSSLYTPPCLQGFYLWMMLFYNTFLEFQEIIYAGFLFTATSLPCRSLSVPEDAR